MGSVRLMRTRLGVCRCCYCWQRWRRVWRRRGGRAEWSRWRHCVMSDLKYALRMLIRNPMFTAIAVLTLALGIGANTAIFSVVDAVLLRPLPYPQVNRLVFLWSTWPAQGVAAGGSALPDYQGWRDRNQVFDGLAGFYYGDFNLSTSDAVPERIQGAYVTVNFFQVLRISPAIGRLFAPEEEQPADGGR